MGQSCVATRSPPVSRPIPPNLDQSRPISATLGDQLQLVLLRLGRGAHHLKVRAGSVLERGLGRAALQQAEQGDRTRGWSCSIACGEEWYTLPAAGAVGSAQSTCSKPTRKSALVRSPTPFSEDHSKYAVTNQERGGAVSRTNGRTAEGQQRRRDVPRLLAAHQQHLERVVGRRASVGEVLHLLTAAGVNRRCLHQRQAWARSFAITRRAEPAPSRARAARTTA